MDLYVSRMMSEDLQTPGRLQPGVSVEELPAYYRKAWKEMSDMDKNLWRDRYEEVVENYETQMSEWRAGGDEDAGSFTAVNG